MGAVRAQGELDIVDDHDGDNDDDDDDDDDELVIT